MNTCVKCHQRKGPRGEAVRRQRGCPPGPGVQRWMNCVPEIQQAAEVEELVVGVEDPLEMSDTKQGDIGLETQQESDTSDEDIQDTQAAAATTQKGKGTGKGKTDKRSKKPPVLFSADQEQKLVDFLRDNEILYNKRLMDYKDRSKNHSPHMECHCP